ncbi:hypothetical protein M501DRAFT_933500 [Patellaria atrata CBS 101060]|uniref:Uncharacterized protein n=1 Tax=Patellaria atrata CBS 101060 TaxID=1346257 RepID=A0A9P4SCT2_9PEZI|nr:hypothetical protein M501DRAFT_933500 [Patellaria atrata CBS 101060]
MRSLLQGASSSIYSQSPQSSQSNTPKIPMLGFLRRPGHTQSQSTTPELEQREVPNHISNEAAPIVPQHTAGSYQRAIIDQMPEVPRIVHTRQYSSADPETEELARIVHRRARKRQRKAFTRSRHTRKGNRSGSPAHRKAVCCMIAGSFLVTILTTYLSIALTHPTIGQEVHVLFILVILVNTIIFCHSLIRLCMLALRPHRSDRGPRIPSMTGPEGFRPIKPIRVHLARDDEIVEEETRTEFHGLEIKEEKKSVQLPPPAYGLWRCSVRVDPNLLHWQRIENVSSTEPLPDSHRPVPLRSGSAPESERPTTGVARPPSYISDDGVDYVVSAVPRSTVQAESSPSLSDIHPAYRDFR